MKPLQIVLILQFFVFCLNIYINAQLPANTKVQNGVQASEELSARQQAIVTISTFTARGNIQELQKALNSGLNAGLSISEIKEILVQLYAYAGFPRSLNALQSFMGVLKERKQKGIKDKLGKAPNPLPANKTKLQLGTELQTKLVGQSIKGEIYEFAPAIDQFLKEHLFGDIFGRDNLDFKTREIATISALATLGGVENQLRSHFGVGMYNGITERQLNHLVSIIQVSIGVKEGNAAKQVLQVVLKQRENGSAPEKTDPTTFIHNAETIFTRGEKITNNNFVGNAWLQQMILPDSLNLTQVGNVTFEPGARTNWHLHPGGQILLITAGTGYYQEKGSQKNNKKR